MIEKMTKKHIDRVAEIEKECFSHPWSIKSLESELANENSHFYVAYENGVIAGYIGMNIVIDEGYIYNVAVSEKFRKKGIGSSLVNHLVTYGKKNNLCFLTLEVRAGNLNAQSLYSKFGFIKVGERKNYYSEPAENAILMTKYF